MQVYSIRVDDFPHAIRNCIQHFQTESTCTHSVAPQCYVFHIDKRRKELGLLVLDSEQNEEIDKTSDFEVYINHGRVRQKHGKKFFCKMRPSEKVIRISIAWFDVPESYLLMVLYNKHWLPVIRKNKKDICYEGGTDKRSLVSKAFTRINHVIGKKYIGSWLFIDRDCAAGDNAESLYRWITNNHPDRKIYFALSPTSPDWNRLEQEGFRLVNSSGWQYLLAYLNCEWLISSNMTGYITKPGIRWKFSEYIQHKFCFLQHGVTKDFQPTLNRVQVEMMISSGYSEYAAFTCREEYPYVFTAREMRLTGMPRHDELLNSLHKRIRANTILVMPTWRKSIVHELIPGTGSRKYNEIFKNSAFFQEWSQLIKILAPKVAENGMTLTLYLHPYLQQQVKDFVQISGCGIAYSTTKRLRDIIMETALFITDYSSVAFDVAMIHRPVIYYQFDARDFEKNHTYVKGYFDYERDGFGPVATTTNEVEEFLKNAADSRFELNGFYRKRVDEFFTYTDGHNSERVYNALESWNS